VGEELEEEGGYRRIERKRERKGRKGKRER